MKKIFLALNIIILLGSFYGINVSANNSLQFNPAGLKSAVTDISIVKSHDSTGISVKNSGTYDESTDPLMRRGTQNTDAPQGIFFAIPFVLTVIFFIALFLRKK
jgi:hypothetical protein